MNLPRDILQQEIVSKIEILSSKDNLPIFEIDGYITNSKYNPINEAIKLAQLNFKKNHIHVLLGIGAGYIAKELFLKLSENEVLLIIEPNVELFKKLIKVQDLQYLIDDKKVTVITGLNFEYFEEYLSVNVVKFNNRLQLIVSPNYEKIYPSYSKQVLMTTKDILLLQVVNKNTMKRFFGSWQENFIENLYHVFTANPFSHLRKRLNCPVVITAGGPSLIKHMQLIKERRNQMFLLCAGSTINSLLANNIIPDAIVSIDGGYENYKHFENLSYLEVPLLFSPKLHKDILKIYKGKKILFTDKAESRNNKLIDEIVDYQIGEVYGGPSVANYCLDIAVQLTTGPICMIGQDLAYTNNTTHAEGNKNYSVINEHSIEERMLFKVAGYDGGDVLTDYPLFSMKKAFEEYCKHALKDSNQIFNCTEGGAKIEGIENILFSNFVNNYCNKDLSKEVGKVLNETRIEKTKEQWDNLFNVISDEKRKSKKVMILCKESLEVLSKIDKETPSFNFKIIKQLDKFDRKLKVLLKNEFLFYLFGEVSFNINNYYLEQENETEEELQKRIYLKSCALYEGIHFVSNESIAWFEKLLEKISSEKQKGELNE
ncbi:motility associated factor glycosyltransferase family protein [Sutcliffiella halmapala]|uniref:motility associated factor glycosyltransferase family protein n=1 Tax=Sutcliffiella halmapala TaxID=79882 RepID=UPI000995505D|nr:6-hydroxymethylpterin diphosphokinase MptE-like protein [Sutcliffiella halmapala]